MYFNSEDVYLAQAQRTSKQNFLREEILDNGFDPHEFTDFINSKRGTDIDLWSFDELKDIVSQFKVHLKQQSKQLKKLKSQPQPIPQPVTPNPVSQEISQPLTPSSHSSSPEIQISDTQTLEERDLSKELEFNTLSDSDLPSEKPDQNSVDQQATSLKIDTVYQIAALKAHANELSRAEKLEVKMLE